MTGTRRTPCGRTLVRCVMIGLGVGLPGCVPESPLAPGPCCESELPEVPGLSATASAGTGASRATWVALEPGKAEGGFRAELLSSSGGTAAAAVIAGGFDPVRVGAFEGDTVEVRVLGVNDDVLKVWRVLVRAEKEPPIIVRTEPPPRKRDVPLNARLVVVFNEPVDPGSVTAETVTLRRGTTQVPGTVVLEAPGWRAVWTPDAELDPNTDYELRVEGVRDLTGAVLVGTVLVPFTTGGEAAGTLRVVTSTTGGSFDPDGYRVVVDGDLDAASAIGGNDTTDIPLLPGEHAVLLTGLAEHCTTTDSTHAVTVTSSASVTTGYAITCVPVGARHLGFVSQPNDITAGSPFFTSVQVALQDSAGNLVDMPGDSVTISVELVDAFGTCGAQVWCGPLGANRRALAGGVATFAGLSVPLAGGAYVLVATMPGIPPATSIPFTVVPGPAVLALPGSPQSGVAIAGEPFAIAVIYSDQYGNVASAPAATVTMGLAGGPPGGALRGTLTQAAGEVFTNLIIDLPGSGYSLVASVPGLTSGTSLPFRVSGRARTLIFQQFAPAQAIAGYWLRQPIDVAALDSLGRPDSTFSGWVGLRMVDNPGGAEAWTSQRLAVNSVASGIPYRIDRPGSGYTLEAIAEGISTGPGPAFDVLPATAVLGFLRAGDIHVASTAHAGIGTAHSNRDWTACAVGAQAFAWSPDGGLAWGTRCNGDLTIVPQAADGSTPLWLPRLPGLQATWSGLAWSTNGREVLVALTRTSDGALLTYSVDGLAGGTPTPVANHGPGAELAWSPDRSRVVFRSWRDDPAGDIYTANGDGSTTTRLTSDPADDRNPAWSPDGGRIAFASDRAGGWDLYIMNADGSQVTRLTSGGPALDAFSPAWSPDGTALAFVQMDGGGVGRLMVVNADGSSLRAIGEEGQFPAWHP